MSSYNYPELYIRLDPSDGSDLFREDSTFHIREALHNSL
ncbi:MAG: hypothetical protein F6K14_20165 [Symploca sp. SIO2C1]|nr:hypothetical protein [Symploca sp. SIO2C1]